jgi:hypothetical protein
MTDMSVNFVGNLPSKSVGRRRESRYDALTVRPGVWAEWWGDVPKSVRSAAVEAKRAGFRFEGAIRNGKGYIRAVPADE